jgi:hypothetical protein
MLWSLTNHHDATFATDDLAVSAHLFDRRADFHKAMNESDKVNSAFDMMHKIIPCTLRMILHRYRDVARLLEAERDPALREIIWTDLTFDVIARHDPDTVLAEFTPQIPNDYHVVLEFHSE